MGFQGVTKGRAGRFAFGHAIQEISDLMNKAMFIPNLEAGNPPFGHVRVFAITDMDGSPAANATFVPVFEILEPMQIVKIPENGGVLAVNLEGVKRFMAARITGGFEGRKRTIAEPGEECAGVVDPYGFNFAGEVMF